MSEAIFRNNPVILSKVVEMMKDILFARNLENGPILRRYEPQEDRGAVRWVS